MKLIQILGAGCAKCDKLKQNAEEAVAQSGVAATVEKITDINEITSFGVSMVRGATTTQIDARPFVRSAS